VRFDYPGYKSEIKMGSSFRWNDDGVFTAIGVSMRCGLGSRLSPGWRQEQAPHQPERRRHPWRHV